MLLGEAPVPGLHVFERPGVQREDRRLGEGLGEAVKSAAAL